MISKIGKDDKGQVTDTQLMAIIEIYHNLYHAIENTTNQNTGRPLYIRGIKPNLPCDLIPAEHLVSSAIGCIFYDMV